MQKYLKFFFFLFAIIHFSNGTYGQQLDSRNRFLNSTECKIKASFTLPSDTIGVGIPIELNTKVLNIHGLFWLCNGIKIDSVSRINYAFRKKGNYEIALVVFDDKCVDTARKKILVVSGGWANRAHFEGAERSGAVSFVLGNKAYITTGYDGNNYLKDLWMWNKTTNVWTQKADFGGTARANAVAFAIDSRGYVATGSDGADCFSDLWKYNPNTNLWSRMKDFSGAKRCSAVSFTIDNFGYIGFGNDSAELKNDFWKYNPQGDIWTNIGTFSTAGRKDAFGFSVGNKGYVGGGFDTQNRNDFWEYNPAENKWTQKAKYPGLGRVGMVGFGLNSNAYLGTGSDGVSSKKDFWEYNTKFDKWKRITDVANFGRTQAVAFTIEGKGYVATGYVGASPFSYYSKELIEYDPANCGLEASFMSSATTTGIGNTVYFTNTSNYDTSITSYWAVDGNTFSVSRNFANTSYVFNRAGDYTISLISENEFCRDSMGQVISVVCSGTWSTRPKLPSYGREAAVGVSVGYKGYIGLGREHINNQLFNLNDFWEWDNQKNCWTQKSDFPGLPRHGAIAFSCENKAYVGCGDIGTANSIFTNDFWEYNPQTNYWSRKAAFPGTPRSYAASFAIDKTGYIITGLTKDSTCLSDFYSYNAQNNTWSQKGRFPGISRAFAVGFNMNNKGYVATGKDIDDRDLADFWEYDPTNSSWQKKADMPIGRNSGVGFGIGAKALIGTGINAGGRLKDFWEFDPYTNMWIQKRPLFDAGRSNAIGFSIGSLGFIGFGADDTEKHLSDFNKYSPDSCVYISTPPATNITAGAPINSINSNVWLNIDAGSDLYYEWRKDNAIIPGANKPYYEAKESGKYAALIINQEGVVVTSDAVNVSIYRNSENQSQQNKYEAKTFYQYGMGYGYSIYQNGVLFIYQPNIPAYPGFKGFEKEGDSKKVAEFVVTKLRKKIMPPSVSVSDLKNLNVVLD